MTPDQALKLLSDMAAQVNAPRAVHLAAIQATEILRGLIEACSKQATE